MAGGKVRTSWKPGQSGNPNGRPKDALKDAIQRALAETVEVKKGNKVSKKVANEIIIEKALELARKGNLKAMELLWDRGYGKAIQAMEIDGRLEHSVPTIQVEVVKRTTGSDQ